MSQVPFLPATSCVRSPVPAADLRLAVSWAHILVSPEQQTTSQTTPANSQGVTLAMWSGRALQFVCLG